VANWGAPPRILFPEVVVESKQQTESSATQSSATTRHKEGRDVWVLTVYGICGLALFAVLAYFFSQFVTH
jgi:hypothetical protein